MTNQRGPKGQSNIHDLRSGARITGVARLVFTAVDGEEAPREVGRFIQRSDGEGAWTEFVPARGVDDVDRELLEAVHAGAIGGELRHGDAEPDDGGVADLDIDLLDVAERMPVRCDVCLDDGMPCVYCRDDD